MIKDNQQGLPPYPGYFFRPRIFVWAPHETFPEFSIKCPKCSQILKPKGWPEAPRLIYGLNFTYLLFARVYVWFILKICINYFIIRYSCSNTSCNTGKVLSSNADFLARMPKYAQYEFPAVLTHRSGVDKDVVHMLKSCIGDGMGPTKLARMIRENYTRLWAERSHQYINVVRSIQEQQAADLSARAFAASGGPSYQPSVAQSFPIPTPFSDLDSFPAFKENRYGGKYPSGDALFN